MKFVSIILNYLVVSVVSVNFYITLIFVNIPFKKILDILKYKLEENGIECKEQEESYTSKSSYLDNDNIPTYHKGNLQAYIFSGKRITRNLYQSKQGKIINADLNGALNILKKIR